MAEKLIIFTRFPQPGRAKTRLIPALGAAGAADLHRRMSERIVRLGRELAADLGTVLELCHDGGDAGLIGSWLGADLKSAPQGEGDLGARMGRAFTRAWLAGDIRTILIGADCPALSVEILQSAFVALADHDLVLGPAVDGGYYLIGLSRPAPELFRDQPWGESTLLATTLSVAKREGLCTQLLEELADIDRPEDLRHLDNYPDLE